MCFGLEFLVIHGNHNYLFILFSFRLPPVKDAVIAHIETEADQYLGMPMTYTIFESIKEKLDNLLQEQPESLQSVTSSLERVQLGACSVAVRTCSKFSESFCVCL